jgi:hypothetical protein
MKKLQIVMEVNQWKWMLNSLKMQMINIFAIITLLKQHVLEIKLRGCDGHIIQKITSYCSH